MRRALLIAGALAALIGCNFQREEHPDFDDCVEDSDCPTGQRCYRSFCVGEVGMDAGPADAGPDAGGGDACAAEVDCNGVDDDCDGTTDEFADSACDTGEDGACGAGTLVCQGTRAICSQTTLPTAEVCNGEDDDCDGDSDEEIPPRPCYGADSGCTLTEEGDYTCLGLCQAGTQACVDGDYGACEGEITPATEVCTSEGFGADEDCDGSVDGGCACEEDRACYAGPPDTAGVGQCRAGVQTCEGDVLLETCEGQVPPTPETCLNQGFDDDCDGRIDEIPGFGDPCVAESEVGACRGGRIGCMGATGAATRCVPAAPIDELCNRIDDDCNGNVDEGFDTDTDEMNCGACGNVCSTGESCCGGTCVDTRTSGDHCGACAADAGDVCTGDDVCCNGSCIEAAACADCSETCTGDTEECCSGACIDTATSLSHCGGCGIACTAGQVCCGGSCVSPDDPETCGAGCDVCDAGTELCCNTGGGRACVPIGDDYCGTCSSSCSTGSCCESSCVDYETDVMNCGECGTTCTTGQFCSSGHCCPTGQTWCGDDATGSCVNTSTDSNHCGGCGTRCGGLTPKCCGGTCRGGLFC